MDVQRTISLMGTLGVITLAWATGCELSVEGAPCPCGPGWACAEVDPEGAGSETEEQCVRPYCVSWTYPERDQGIDVPLSENMIVVSGFTNNVPPGSVILVTGSGNLGTTTGGHTILVEPGGRVSGTGAGNTIFLQSGARYDSESGTDNEVTYEPGAVFVPNASDGPIEEVEAIDFVGTVEVPFAAVFQELRGMQHDADRGGFADYLVRSGGDVWFPRARANNLFIEEQGNVSGIDFSSVVYLQRDAVFNAGSKSQIIHYVAGARIENTGTSTLMQRASLDLDLCTM